MGQDTKIEWCHHSFNGWVGCLKIQPECKNCYAEVETFPRVQRGRGLELWGPPETTFRHITSPDNWKQLMKWNRQAERDGIRRRVFCHSMSDVCEDIRFLDEPRAWLMEGIARTPMLDCLLLTKRPENFTRLFPWGDTWPRNVWAGTTGGTQKTLNANVTALKKVPAAVRFVSIEPLLEPVTLFSVDEDGQYSVGFSLTAVQHRTDYGTGVEHDVDAQTAIDWVIVGGESGPEARPCALEWLERVVAECQRVDVPVFCKQFGSVLAREYGGDPKGGNIQMWPEYLRVREFPYVS